MVYGIAEKITVEFCQYLTVVVRYFRQRLGS